MRDAYNQIDEDEYLDNLDIQSREEEEEWFEEAPTKRSRQNILQDKPINEEDYDY